MLGKSKGQTERAAKLNSENKDKIGIFKKRVTGKIKICRLCLANFQDNRSKVI
jgi:hypothetical protein